MEFSKKTHSTNAATRIITALTALLCIAAAIPVCSAVTVLDTPLAEAAFLGEAVSGQTLYDSLGADTRRNPDSLTKIMTLLLAAEAAEREESFNPRSQYVTVSQTAVDNVPNRAETVNLSTGESMCFMDMLMCMYIGDGADAANAVAEFVSGSIESFVEEMNLQAAELGCENTYFVNTHGQGSTAQYTTARDLFIIAREAASHDLFMEVAGTESYTVPVTNFSAARTLGNTNYLTVSARARYYYRYALAGKVSATYDNGYGSVEIAERGGLRLISVILGAKAVILDDQSTQMQNLSEARRLFDWGFENYSWRTVLTASKPVARAPVAYGAGADYVNLKPEREVVLLLADDVPDEAVIQEIKIAGDESGEQLNAPIYAGEMLGELIISYMGREVMRVGLIADTSVELLRVAVVRDRIIGILRENWGWLIFAVLIILFVIYVLLVARYKRLRRRRRQELADKRESERNREDV